MTNKHTLQELAADPELWVERIDPHDNAPFDDFTQSQREEIIWQSFGDDFNEDGTPVNTHGGPREGAGRNPLSDTEPTEKHTVSAPASVWRLLEKLGGGVRSKGLRRVVAAYESRSAITIRPKPEVSHYGDGEIGGEAPDLRMEDGE